MSQPPRAKAPEPDRITTGTMLSGRYTVEEVVGYGGMASVFRGRDRLLDRAVAIKVMNARLGAEDADRAAFLREARAAASLQHPGIAGTFDAGIYAGWPFIVMEFIPGASLKQLIDREAPLPAARATQIAARVADALQYGHGRGVVHCDVKPQNVLLDGDGMPKLVDFGISQSIAATAAFTATVSGTAGYLAPEQLEGVPLDGRADVYSLGTVLYEMLTGELPFDASNLAALATRRLVADPRPIRALNPRIPPKLADVVMRCLSRDRVDRYRSAAELAAALRGLGAPSADGRAERLRSPTAGPERDRDATQIWRREEMAAASGRGRRALFAALLALLLALLVAMVVALGAVISSRGGSSSAIVPDVQNARLDDATKLIHAAGLRVSVELTPSDQLFGTVVGEDPAPGTVQSKANPVTLHVSLGPGR